MEFRTLGRTGLEVSIAGLGGGGASRLGLATGSSFDQALLLVRRAFDLGINYFDTADNYGTEELIGTALEGHRQEIYLSSKVYPRIASDRMISSSELVVALDNTLERLGTDYLDVYHLHGVSDLDYSYCRDELIPQLIVLQAQGKVRFVGISESNSADPEHLMLQTAIRDDCWDVVMTGFNLFNQSARLHLFPLAAERSVGVEIMASARSEFSQPVVLAELIRNLVANGDLDPKELEGAEPVACITKLAGVDSLTDLSYRFAKSQSGVHTVLVGTGSVVHLEQNVRGLSAIDLSSEVIAKLAAMFGHLARAVRKSPAN